MRGVITARHFLAIAWNFGWRIALRVLLAASVGAFTGRRVTFLSLVAKRP